MIKPFLLHPAAVHFPIALLLTGLAAAAAGMWSKRQWLADAVSWLLWLGTASAWVAVALGLLARKTAPHVPPAWKELSDHKALGLWAAGLFTALSLWRAVRKDLWPKFFLTAWFAAAAVLVAAAYHGGELVFTYNMGTAASAP